jgi:hypothetical protein
MILTRAAGEGDHAKHGGGGKATRTLADLPRRQLKPRRVRALAPSTALRAVPSPALRGRISPGHLVPYSVNTKSRPSTIVWQAKPHLASLPCGGWFASVPGANVLAAAS